MAGRAMRVRRWKQIARSQLNRIVVALALLVALPLVAVSQRIRLGAGRRVAVGAVRTVARACGVRIEVRKSPDIDADTAYVFVANHSSPLDIGAVLVACPDVRFVAAAELFRIPLLAAAMRALDTVPLERRDPALARRQLVELARAHTSGTWRLVIFPEGGIAPSGERLPFKSGAFSLAIQVGVQVVPVAISGTDLSLPPRSFLAVRPGRVTVQLLAPVSTRGLQADDRGALRDEVRDIVVTALRSEF
jgi:1-acyl-sn-glycerol-3-phosphate acyltransferase